MKIRVNPHTIEIVKEQTEPINELEIKVSKCEFEFDEAITSDFVKEAYFTLNGDTYKQIIVNNECDYPSEVLTEKGTLEIGVVAYLVENEQEIKRYNPSPDYFESWVGSLKDAENSEPITPSEMEQFEQALNDGLNEVANVDIDAEKTGNKSVVTITNRQGIEKVVEILDGANGEKGDNGADAKINGVNTLTIEAGTNITLDQEGSTLTINSTGGGTSNYADLTNKPQINSVELNGNKTLSDLGIQPAGNYALSSEIPTKISDLTNDSGFITSYIETDPTVPSYVKGITQQNITNWNNKADVEDIPDLTDYVKNTDYATASKGGVIKGTGDYSFRVDNQGRPNANVLSYSDYSSYSTNNFISKGTLENVITGKGLVSNTDYATSSVGGVVKANSSYGVSVNENGIVYALSRTYAQYSSDLVNYIISKGTLENVITGKNLADKNYVDTAIANAITNTLGGNF